METVSAFFVFCIFIRKWFDLIEEFTVMFTKITFTLTASASQGQSTTRGWVEKVHKYFNNFFDRLCFIYIYKLDMLMYWNSTRLVTILNQRTMGLLNKGKTS